MKNISLGYPAHPFDSYQEKQKETKTFLKSACAIKELYVSIVGILILSEKLDYGNF